MPTPARFSHLPAALAFAFAGLLAATSSAADGPIPPSGVTAASLGSGHGCAINSTQALRCWGANSEGQVGDGTTTNRPVPVDLGISAAQVVTGAAHTCALAGGVVSCWGRNAQGQLGDGTTTSRPTPAPVPGLTGVLVLSIAAGYDHTCAIIAFGAIRCWGANGRGQLGDGTTTSRSSPVAVIGSARSAVAGAEHTCVKTPFDSVRCWGRNSEGQLGDGTTTDRLVPVDVVESAGVVSLAAGGFHNCMVDQFDGIRCWGANGTGQIGDATHVDRSTPTYPIQLGANMVAVAAGAHHSCGLHRDGTASCWGSNQAGQVGDGTQTPRSEPALAAGLGDGAAALLGGGDQSCAYTRLGGLMCWGANDAGQLGDGSFTMRTRPVNVAGLAGKATISAGERHNCVITAAGNIACWGANNSGQVGDGTTVARTVPTVLDGYTGGILSLGGNHSCTGSLCWGANGAGEFGDGTTTGSAIPTYQPQLESIAAMAANEFGTCSLSTSGEVKCWGSNAFGQVGDGTNTQRLSPVTVSGLGSGVAGLASKYLHSCAVTTAGAVKCWGSGISGQLGNGGVANSNVPVDVVGLASGVASVVTGASFSCALTNAGGVKCWGTGNVVGGFTLLQAVPVDIAGLASGVTALGAGNTHACARLDTGEVKCWGANESGQVGDGTTTPRNAPVSVAGITAGAGVIAAGSQHTCVLMLSGRVQCWGKNTDGVLGDGTTTQRLAPVYAVTPLSISRTGNGTIVSVPPLISCGATCIANVPFGGLMRLIAMPPPPGVEFAGWSGGACFGTAPCDLVIVRPTTVGASFITVSRLPSDFDADGRSDILFTHADGRSAIWLMDGVAATATAEINGAATGWSVAHVADLDGNGKSDLVWQHTDGSMAIYLMNGTSPATTQQMLNPGAWSVTHTPDLDGDGKADLVFRHTDGSAAVWLMHGTVVADGASIIGAGTGWNVIATGDFDGDGKDDLLWKHDDGRHAIWLMDGVAVATANQMLNSGNWTAVQVADLDGDGKSDIVWQHADGTIAAWLMDGPSMGTGAGLLGPGTGWSVARTGDFNGDGKADLLFQHTDGRAAIYLMNGLTPISSTQILNAGGGWSAMRVQDLDGDGKADIVWQNADGSIAVWLMDGATATSSAGLLPAGTGWSVSTASR